MSLVADDADDGAHLAAAEVRLEPQFTNALQNMFNVFFGGVGTEDNNHGGAHVVRVNIQGGMACFRTTGDVVQYTKPSLTPAAPAFA